MLHADIRGMLALVAVVMCCGLSVVLFRAGVRGSVARKLALLLVVEGVALASSGSIEYLFGSLEAFYQRNPSFAMAEIVIHALGDCGMLALYPPFLAAALNTRWTRPFADRRVRIGVASGAAVLYAALLWPLAKSMRTSAPLDFRLLSLPTGVLYVALVVLFAFAFATSLRVWYTSTGAARKRARIFAVAFGIRDACWGFIYATQVWALSRGDYADVFTTIPPWFIVYTLGTFLAVPLIAYGILRTQLFDIDLRIRWTIKQSTLAAAVIAIVYVLSEGASRLLSNELGNIAGLLAAAVVVFFLAPLQRFAEHVSRAAMPNTNDTPEYAVFRKLQVYEAAVGDALPGGISPEGTRAAAQAAGLARDFGRRRGFDRTGSGREDEVQSGAAEGRGRKTRRVERWKGDGGHQMESTASLSSPPCNRPCRV